MSWIELSLNTMHEAVDWVCTLLSATRYTDDIYVIKYTNLETISLVNPETAEPQWAFTIRLYLVNSTYIKEIENSLLSLYRAGLCSSLQETVVENKPQLEDVNPIVHRVAQHFVILTPEVPYTPTSNEIVLRLKTNLAFGSGLHPTTILNLQLLERHVVPKMNVLDLGSGSGILSIAMAKLGAYVLAVDNDSVAVESTQDAVKRNGVEQQVTVIRGSLGRGSEMGHWMGIGAIDRVSTIEETQTFDLITANILARIHISLASDYRQALCRQDGMPSGLLIASGFDTDYENAVNAAFTEVGFEAMDKEQLDEWVAIAYRLSDK